MEMNLSYPNNEAEIKEFARQIRINSVKLVNQANSSHIGGALSVADVLAVLYSGAMNINPEEPKWDKRDRLIFSKGHCCVALYSTLALKGFFPYERLKEYGQENVPFICHVSHKVPGIELSTGSLGHGLPFGVGLALAAKRNHQNHRIYVILGDGEMDEGSNWEAFAFAAHHNLDNITVIVDNNHIQALGFVEDVFDMRSMRKKLEAFNWNVEEVDGHNVSLLIKAIENSRNSDKPTAIIADTIKGKGVSFMENELKWHYSSPRGEMFDLAIKELEGK